MSAKINDRSGYPGSGLANQSSPVKRRREETPGEKTAAFLASNRKGEEEAAKEPGQLRVWVNLGRAKRRAPLR